ncbi:MAG: gliding motility-associated C-terminal domain-containing protein [Flavobacteriales bacterium]|nr:gliding motility-associated C-terminal domain-containing protein [Flavobacteriales bacterium]
MRAGSSICLLIALIGLAIPSMAQPTCAISLGSDVTICAGGTTTLTLPSGYTNMLWSTGATGQNITTGTSGTYWGQVSYPSGNLVYNGDFSAGNAGFWTPYTYSPNLQVDGNYYIGTNAQTYHPQWSCTGNGNFLMLNSGFAFAWMEAWCQGVTVCPGQTYTLSFRMANLANTGPCTVEWMVDWSTAFGSVTASNVQGQWNTYNTTWTAGPNQTFANFCLRITSGWGIGNDLGLDDISISGNIVLRDTVQVNVTPLPVVDLGPDQTLCAGDPVLLDATQPGGTYLWQDGSTNATLNVATAGTYSVDVTVNGCTSSDAVDVSFDPLPVVDLGSDTTLCPGTDLTLTITQPNSGVVWQNGSNANDLFVNAPGTYSVSVTDLNGCIGTDAINVAYASPDAIDLGNDTTLCAGASLLLDASLPGATYLWSNGATTSSILVGSAGTYGVTVQQGACGVSDAIQVSLTSPPTVDLGNDTTLCPGEVLLLDASATGGSYLWQDGTVAPTHPVQSAGIYSVQVTDAFGCTGTDAIDVGYAQPAALDLGPDVTLCPGVSIMLDATLAGATYLWSTGGTSSTIQVQSAGTYWVQVGQGSCSVSDTVTIDVVSLPAVDLGPDIQLCAGDQTTITANAPGAALLWSDGSSGSSVTVGGAGTYWVQATIGQCTVADTLVVAVVAAPVLDLGNDTTLCAGTDLDLHVNLPGASVVWSDGSSGSDLLVSAPGTYWATVTLGSCSATDTTTVTYLQAIPLDLGPDQTICSGSVVTLDADVPGSIALWSDGSNAPTLTISTAGTYWVDVSLNGCLVTDTMVLNILPTPVIDLGPDTTICDGDMLVLDATTPGATYLWQDGITTPIRAVSVAGNYMVTVDLNGCMAQDAFLLSMIPLPNIDLGSDTTLCTGAQLTLSTLVPGAVHNWSDGSSGPTFDVLAPGAIWLEESYQGCSASDTVIVNMLDPGSVDLGPDTMLCPGQTLLLTVIAPGTTITWEDGSNGPDHIVNMTGNYSVTVNVGGCTAGDAIDVDYVNVPSGLLGDDLDQCPGDTIVLQLPPTAVNILWSDGSTQQEMTVTEAGTYSVQAEWDGCPITDLVDVTLVDPPHVDLGPDMELCEGEDLLLSVDPALGDIVWSTGSNDAQIHVDRAGTYLIAITGECGSAMDSVHVALVDCGPYIHVPNAFTPDGDGMNEAFLPVVDGPLLDYAFDIFDRWGERIFSSTSPEEGWDGTLAGSLVPDGVYVWQLRYKAVAHDGVKQDRLIGHVTLLR